MKPMDPVLIERKPSSMMAMRPLPICKVSWRKRKKGVFAVDASPRLPTSLPGETDHFVADKFNPPQHTSSVTSSRLVSGVLKWHQFNLLRRLSSVTEVLGYEVGPDLNHCRQCWHRPSLMLSNDDDVTQPLHPSSVTSFRLVSGGQRLHQPELHGADLRHGQLYYCHQAPNLT